MFELAIIRVLINNEELFSGGKHRKNAKPKIVYSESEVLHYSQVLIAVCNGPRGLLTLEEVALK